MATASIPGFKALLWFASSSAGAVYAKFGEIREFTLTLAGGSLDATSKDSAGWKENLPGLKEWSGSGAGLYLMETADAGQEKIYTMLTGGTNILVQLKEGSSTPTGPATQLWSGMANVTGLDVDSPLDGPAGIKITLKGTAALTKATIST